VLFSQLFLENWYFAKGTNDLYPCTASGSGEDYRTARLFDSPEAMISSVAGTAAGQKSKRK
jgi:hypothetical protein